MDIEYIEQRLTELKAAGIEAMNTLRQSQANVNAIEGAIQFGEQLLAEATKRESEKKE